MNVRFPIPRSEVPRLKDAGAHSGLAVPEPERSAAKPQSDTCSLEHSTAAPVSSALSSNVSLEGVEAVLWDEITFRRPLQFVQQHAYCAEDVHLLSSFLELTPLTTVEPAACKLLLRVLRFLRLCDYSLEDICTILAHASAYFLDTYIQCGKQMQAGEMGHVLGTLIFIAHCYVQDETCPLNLWHKHLFWKYCPLKMLNAAVVRLIELRRYRLRIADADLSKRLSHLYTSIARFGTLDLRHFGRFRPSLRSGLNEASDASKCLVGASVGYPSASENRGLRSSSSSGRLRLCT